MNATPPVAEKKPYSSTRHGIERTDDYHWLRDPRWQEVMRDPAELRPEIRDYLEAENHYFQGYMEGLEESTQEIYREIRGRIKEDDSTVPFKDGPFAYFSHTGEGQQYSQLCRTDREGGNERTLIDFNLEAGGGYFRSGGYHHSPDHRLLAWSCDRTGSEYFTIFVRDLATGTETGDQIVNTTGDLVWAADSRSFFYVVQDENHRPHKIFNHRLGKDVSTDRLVYEETDPGFFASLGKTSSGKLILIKTNDHETSEVRFVPADDPDSEPVLVSARMNGRQYGIEEAGDTLFILTNADGATDFKLVSTPLTSPGSDNWSDLIPHRAGVLIEHFFLKKDFLIRKELCDGLPRLVLRNLETNSDETIGFDEEAYTLAVSAGYEYDDHAFRYYYASPATPTRIFDYDLIGKNRILRKSQEVPSGHDPDHYVVRRLFATSQDGETIPVTVLHHKKTELNGESPLLLYGYGSYGMSIPADFSISALSLVDRGAVYAIAHVRGGMEKGYDWYLRGKREHKSNTFNDFMAAAEMLIDKNYTSRGKVAAMGGSAGGMLMGVIANQAPGVFGSIVALVPFVDVLNTMLDSTLPLTPPEWPEWGNPVNSLEDYKRIARYSPYDNVTRQDYPAIYVTAGLSDPRVAYWEPAKWVARLRANKTDSNPLLFKTHMGAGHSGKSGRFERIRETALAYAFILATTCDKPVED